MTSTVSCLCASVLGLQDRDNLEKYVILSLSLARRMSVSPEHPVSGEGIVKEQLGHIEWEHRQLT